MEPVDPRAMRISDADRHRVADLLREAAGEGRLDLEELEHRLEAAYAAKTYGDLVPITVDLPGHRDDTPPSRQPAPRRAGSVPARGPVPAHPSSFALMSETRRSGPWALGDQHTAVAVMGSVVLDLREADLAAEVTIYASAVMGSVEVVVDARTAVVLEGVPIMGGFDERRSRVVPEIGPDSPVVRIKGFALMGSVDVKRKGPPGELKRRLLGPSEG